MNPATIIKFASLALDLVPKLIAAGMSVSAHIEQTQTALKGMQGGGRDPLPGEWDALNAQVDALRAQLHADAVKPE